MVEMTKEQKEIVKDKKERDAGDKAYRKSITTPESEDVLKATPKDPKGVNKGEMKPWSSYFNK